MKSNHRENTGLAVCLAGVLCNLLLCAGKIVLGIATGLVSVVADGFNNLSDCGSGVVTAVSFFIAKKPADRQHPFGHRRAEYIAALIAGVLVILLAAELLARSIGNLLHGSAPSGSMPVYLLLSLSIAVKIGLFAFYRIFAKKLSSDALRAAATDSLSDALASLAVIAGTALSSLFPSADGWTGVLVSLFIALQGVGILKETSSELLGKAPDPSLPEQIRALLLSEPAILGIHDLQIFSYGKGAVFATVHAEMDSTLTMLSSHTVVDGAEMRVREETGVSLTVHVDPVDLKNPEESVLRLKMEEAARQIATGAEVHDLRIIPGTGKVEFDVGVPYSCKLSDGAIEKALKKAVKESGGFEALIRIERE